MEFVLEFVMTLYLELAVEIVADKKLTPVRTNILKGICLLISTTIFLLLVIGISFIWENGLLVKQGVIMTAVGGVAVSIHAVLFGILIYKNTRNKHNAQIIDAISSDSNATDIDSVDNDATDKSIADDATDESIDIA